MITKDNWRMFARCRPGNPDKIDPELFWPIGNSSPARAQEARAKAECAQCPVASLCLAWSLANEEIDGVSGGMTPDEKRQLLRRRPARVAA
jgi:WhiB family redox-sensing transcriptional regulator